MPSSNHGSLSRGSRSISNDIRGVATEILGEILRLAIDMNPSGHVPIPDLLSNGWHPRPMTSPTILSLVCKRWRRIILNTPSMWTKFLVYLDAPPSRSISCIKLHLARSGTLLLSVFMVRRNRAPIWLDLQERDTVNSLLSAFVGNLHRILSLFIESYHGSSLSGAARLIFGQAHTLEKLKHLALNSVVDDSTFFGNGAVTRLNDPDGPSNINTSSLQTLFIDGQSMLHLVADIPDLQICLQSLTMLAVRGLTFRADAFSPATLQSFFDIVSALPHLDTLTFDDFDVGYSTPSDQGYPIIPAIHPLQPTSARRLMMKNMGSHAVDFVLACITAPHEISLVDCPITYPVDIPRSCSRFKVVAMPWVSRVAMAHMLVGWDGRDLEIYRSPVLVDVFLLTMALLLTSEHHFANLRSITIDNCRIQSVLDFLGRRAGFLD